jgi:hypothetical protein
MKKRLLIGLGIFLVLAVAAVLLDPTRVILGLLRNESFYDNRPTGYWSRQLRDRAPGVQTNAKQELADGGAEAVPVLIELLQEDPDQGGRSAEVRAAAAVVLGQVGPEAKAAVPALTDALKDRDSLVRSMAADALDRIGPDAKPAVPTLVAMLRTDDILIGLALHMYHDQRGSFPPGYVCNVPLTSHPPSIFPNPAKIFDHFLPRPTGVNTTPGWGWAALLLPYLDQGNLYRKLRMDLAIEAPVNWFVRAELLPIYTCPSDLHTGQFYVKVEKTGKPICKVATNSYAACYGESFPIMQYQGSGMFWQNSHTCLKDITDGTSQTLAIGERGALFAQTPWAGSISQGSCRTTPGAPVFVSEIEGAPTMVLARIGRRHLNDPYSEPYDFFSPHAQVVNFVFADASVHALTSAMDPAVLRALATMAANDIVDEADFN